MIHRLKIGSIDGAIAMEGDSENAIIRPAMLVYTGIFQSADGEVKVDDSDIVRLSENHNKVLSKVKRLASNGSTDLPLKYCPPIQLDHSTSARDTVGRLVGEVEARETEIEGKKVKALFGNIKILGADNVERVKDGRWTNLSIGADFDDGVISEVTITPFPAAHESSFLSNKKNMAHRVVAGGKYNGWEYEIIQDNERDGSTYYQVYYGLGDLDFDTDFYPTKQEAIKAAERGIDKVKKENKLSKEGKKEMASVKKGEVKGKGYTWEYEVIEKGGKFTATYGMNGDNDEDLGRFFATANEAEKAVKETLKVRIDQSRSALSDDKDDDDKLTDDKDTDDKDKELSDDEDDKKAKLSAARSKIKTLSAGFGESLSKARLAARQTSIMARFSKLRAAGKITPAEIKKMDISKLSAANQDAIELVMETYESREPVIMAGMYGDARSLDISKVQESRKKAQLEAETRRNMPFIAKVSGTKLSEGDKEADKDTVNVHVDTDPHTDLSAKDDELSEIEKLMDDGNIAEAKKRMKAWASKLKCLSDDNTEGNAKETEKQLSAMVENITQLEAQFNQMQQLASELAE